MLKIKLDEISQNIESFITNIEKGENFIIIKEGKSIAEIHSLSKNETGYKRTIEKVKLTSGIESHVIIEQEREEL